LSSFATSRVSKGHSVSVLIELFKLQRKTGLLFCLGKTESQEGKVSTKTNMFFN